jgi:hypothetical protein
MPPSKLEDRPPWQFHQVELLRCHDMHTTRPAGEDAKLAEIVSGPQRPRRGPQHVRLAAQDDVERVGGGAIGDGSFAAGEVGERCAPNELPQLALADAGEEWERREHLGPVSVTRTILVAQ